MEKKEEEEEEEEEREREKRERKRGRGKEEVKLTPSLQWGCKPMVQWIGWM